MLTQIQYGWRRSRWLRPLFWLLVLLISVGGALAVGRLVYRLLPHSYTASSSMLISSQPDVIAAMIAGGTGNLAGAAAGSDALASPPTSDALGSLMAILSSREMLLRIVHKHDFRRELSLGESDAIEALSRMTRFKRISDLGVSVTVTCRGTRWPRRSFLHPRHPFFLSSPLSLEGARRLCAELANSYLTELDNYVTETNLRQAGEMREFLETSKQETDEQLQRIEQRLQSLQSHHAFLDPQNKAAQLLERMKTVEPAYAEAAARVEEVANMHRAAKAQLDGLAVMRISQEIMARNPVITSLEEKLAQLDVDLHTEQAIGKTDQHRDIVRLKTTMESVERQLRGIRAEVRQQVSRQTNPAHDAVVAKVVDLRTEMVGVEARKAQYARLRQALKTDAAQLPVVAREYIALKREQEQYTQLLGPLAQGLGLVALVEKYSRASRFRRLDTAVPPQRPGSSAVILSVVITLLVLLLALLLVIGYLRGAFRIFRVGGRQPR